jgi:hypothetical protein
MSALDAPSGAIRMTLSGGKKVCKAVTAPIPRKALVLAPTIALKGGAGGAVGFGSGSVLNDLASITRISCRLREPTVRNTARDTRMKDSIYKAEIFIDS